MSFSRLLELRAYGVSFLEMEGKRWFLLTSRLTSPSCRSFRCLNELVQHLFVAFLSGMPIWPSAKRQSDSLTPSVKRACARPPDIKTAIVILAGFLGIQAIGDTRLTRAILFRGFAAILEASRPPRNPTSPQIFSRSRVTGFERPNTPFRVMRNWIRPYGGIAFSSIPWHARCSVREVPQ